MLNMIIDQVMSRQDIVFPIVVAGLSGLMIRYTLAAVGQRWVQTYHHTLSFILLPIITLVITKVISGNLTLSIGMVGALSIVRFRNPVKNPFELVILLSLLTIGIAAGVALEWALLLLFLVLGAVVGAHILEKIYALRNSPLFALSFDEGMPANLIETRSKLAIESLIQMDALQNLQMDKQSDTYNYRLAFRTREETDQMLRLLQANPDIEQVNVRYSGSPA
jgi:hypothetical protein